MEVSELRLGNWVDTIEGPARITSISKGGVIATSIMSGGDHSGFVQPIPLTEEILLKVGFKKSGYITFIGNSYQRFALGRNSVYSLNNKDYIYEVNDHQLCELSYVHQLQNLFFALTGEELEITL